MGRQYTFTIMKHFFLCYLPDQTEVQDDGNVLDIICNISFMVQALCDSFVSQQSTQNSQNCRSQAILFLVSEGTNEKEI